MADPVRLTTGELLDQVAKAYYKGEALVDMPSGRRWTYGQFAQDAASVAKGFMAQGLKARDRLALWAPNLPEWLICQMAAAKAGLVLTNMDTGMDADQVRYLLANSGARALVMTPGLKDREFIEIMDKICPELQQGGGEGITCPDLPELKHVFLMAEQASHGLTTLNEIKQQGQGVSDEALARRQASLDYREVSNLIYTSGTTGAPKGVMVAHYGLINVSLASAQNQHLTASDRMCLSVPLSHMFGCICVALTGLSMGATLVIPSPSPGPESILAAVEQERCTAIYGAPTTFLAMMDHPDYPKRDVSSLRTGLMGGAVCPLELMKKVVQDMGVRHILCGYGQTETSSWLTQTSPEDPLQLRVSTTGRTLPGVELKILDPENSQEMPFGQVGEICARGFLMTGYHHLPGATASTIDQEGWLHTGDLGNMDEKGYVRISGRLKEAITKGNNRIYPSDIEEALFSHPKVQNAQVFAVPDPDLGEEVALWVSLAQGADSSEEEILEYCEKHLSKEQIPRYIKFVESFPMTPLGKIQKVKMSEIYAAELKLA